MKIQPRIAVLIIAVLGFLLLPVSSMAQSAESANVIEGVWAGLLGGQLHLVVTITTSNSGEMGGTMNSVDQHAVLALSNVKLHGDAVRFEVPRVGGVTMESASG